MSFSGIMITKIFGSKLPLDVFSSAGRELVIKFKSHKRNGPFHGKNIQAKFVMSYWTQLNGNINYSIKYANRRYFWGMV